LSNSTDNTPEFLGSNSPAVGCTPFRDSGGSADELDAHFLAVFTPRGLVGRDGRKHEKAAN